MNNNLYIAFLKATELAEPSDAQAVTAGESSLNKGEYLTIRPAESKSEIWKLFSILTKKNWNQLPFACGDKSFLC